MKARSEICSPALLRREVGYFLAVENYDVAIIGGGPAGSTAATFSQSRATRDRARTRKVSPISHRRIASAVQHAHFHPSGPPGKIARRFHGKVRRRNAEAGGEKGVRFYFKDGFGSQTDRSYQVTRANFDKMLLDHAAENGVEVREETAVQRLNSETMSRSPKKNAI